MPGRGGLVTVGDAFQFAGFDQLAVHPGDGAEHLQGLFAVAQETIEKFEGASLLTRGQQVGQFPDGGGLLGDDQGDDVLAAISLWLPT